MKTISTALRNHLGQTVTSLATIWRVTRADGAEFYFTDHDVDIVYAGNTYRADNGYTRTSVQNDSSLAVDNLDVMGVFDSADITEEDIRAGKFDYAEIRISVVNWKDLTQGELRVRRGHLGEVILSPQGWFRAEMRGLTQNLSMTIGEVYQAECRADLGDSRCQVPIKPALIDRDTVYSAGTIRRTPTDGSVTELLPDNTPIEEAFENVFYRCTTAGATGEVAPVFDPTPGNTTLEDGRAARNLMTFTGLPANGQVVTIDGKAYTAQTTLTDSDGNFLHGADAAEAQQNLLAAMTMGPGAGTLYAASTTAHTTVDFVQGTGTSIIFKAKTHGTAGNSITSTENMSNVTLQNTSTLFGGIDGCVWTAEEAWTRYGTVSGITDRSRFAVNVTDARAVADWFNGGGFFFETGDNAGWGVEIKDWGIASTAVGTIVLAGAPAAGGTVTVGNVVYTFQTLYSDVPGTVVRGINAAQAAANLYAAITGGAGAGTVYATSTPAQTMVNASLSSPTINLSAKSPGTHGNSIPLVDAATQLSVTGMTGGADSLELFLDTPYDIQIGDKFRIYPGCDKRSATCFAKFDNIFNFRGEPFVPGQDEITYYPDAK